MKTIANYLTSIPEDYQPQGVIHLSGQEEPLWELKTTAFTAFAEDWRALLVEDANGQPLGVVVADDLEADLGQELAQPRQLGSTWPDSPIFPPPPLVYICPNYPQEHPRHLLPRRGPAPLCMVCSIPVPCIER